MRPLRPADPSHDPALEAELEEIARRLRAELGAASPAPRILPEPRRAQVPATVRFFAAVALPGLLLLGVGLLFGTG